MRIAETDLRYELGGKLFEGLLVAPAGKLSLPTVLIFPDWAGRSANQESVARRLAEKGYAAVCVDLYGEGRSGRTNDECEALMQPLISDRTLLRERLLHIVRIGASLDQVDERQLAAIGFCFGGLCVLDLARADAPLAAVASFHGILSPPDWPTAPKISPKVGLFHGWADPMASPEAVCSLAAELTGAGADWQLHAYGEAMHAFMVPSAASPKLGIQYHPRSASRAWAGLDLFLAETLAGSPDEQDAYRAS
jgi:dienelactone hydrolase